jgi:hypothetical protein
MKDKFVVEIYDENEELLTSTVYKSFKQISAETEIDYHNCRTIYSHTIGETTPKYVHRTLKKLLKTVKIKDIDITMLI